jgi:hypothetical protein
MLLTNGRLLLRFIVPFVVRWGYIQILKLLLVHEIKFFREQLPVRLAYLNSLVFSHLFQYPRRFPPFAWISHYRIQKYLLNDILFWIQKNSSFFIFFGSDWKGMPSYFQKNFFFCIPIIKWSLVKQLVKY